MMSSIVIAIVSIASHCGIGDVATEGTLERYWKIAAVMYADVVSVEKGEYGTLGEYVIQLKPLATLSGDFDSAFQGRVYAHAFVGGNSMIKEPPMAGTKVIVLVSHADAASSRIPDGSVTFFPEISNHHRPGIFPVTSFDDPKVTETIENLRKLRGKQREEAEQKAVAEKKGK
jgi:hypothetical protein